MNSSRPAVPRLPFHIFAALTLLGFLAGCSGSSRSTSGTMPPAITSLSPGSVTAGATAFELNVNGTGFVSGSVVQWNGSSRQTTFSSATQLKAAILPADVAAAATAQVVVVNPDAQKSAGASFTIGSAPVSLPTVTALSPAGVVAGSAGFTLSVSGTGYRVGSQVEWNGTKIAATTVVSATQLTASIPPSFIKTAATVPVAVVNTDTGDRSGTLPFTITAAPTMPTLASLSPAKAVAGTTAFILTVEGNGFLAGDTVTWAGAARTTTFVSASQLTASISAADVAVAGNFAVDVIHGSGRSTNQLNFAVTPAPPSLTSIAPANVAAGSAAFDLTVSGTGFTAAATIALNGTSLATTYIGATQLRATIPADSVATARSITVDVVQSGIRSSNQQTFTVSPAMPAIANLSPTTVSVQAAAFTITVTGTGFTPNSVVQWNGSALRTHVQSSTALAADVPASNLTSAGNFQITVANPISEGGTSVPLTFTVVSQAAGRIVQLVSASYLSSAGGNNVSQGQTVSENGRYVGFASAATDLAPNDLDGEYSGFLRDTCVGSTASTGCTPRTVMVSKAGPFTSGSGVAGPVMVSNTGRFAGFDTAYQYNIDVYDTCLGAASGCTSGITQVEEPFPGLSGSHSYSTGLSSRVSPEGRYRLYPVIYTDTNNTATTALVWKDTCFGAPAGCTSTVRRVATGKGTTPPKQSFQSDISEGGRYVLFRAYLTAVDPSLPSDGTVLHIWMQDTCAGAPAGCTENYTLIDVRADGTPSEGNQANDVIADQEPSFSRDGRYVVFSTTDKNMIAGRTINNGSQVYLRDTCVGAAPGCSPSTILISDWPDMATSASRAYLGRRSVSEHGRYVAFMHQGDQSGNFYATNIFVRDTCIGATVACTPSTSKASSDPAGINPATSQDYRDPSISSDGHYVVFSTPVITNGGQVYLALTGY